MSAPATTILLHGFTGAPASWDAVAPRGARVLRPWLPGHGPSPRPVLDFAAEIGALAEWLEREGVEGAHLVGYSMGGRLGWHLLDRDDLIARATLIGAHPGGLDREERAARRASDLAWAERLERDGLEAFLEAWEALPMWSTQRRLADEVREAQRRIRRANTARGLADALRRLGLAEMPARPRPRVPVRLVVGEHDAAHRALADRLDAPVSIVPDAGHNVVLEAPAALAEILR